MASSQQRDGLAATMTTTAAIPMDEGGSVNPAETRSRSDHPAPTPTKKYPNTGQTTGPRRQSRDGSVSRRMVLEKIAGKMIELSGDHGDFSLSGVQLFLHDMAKQRLLATIAV